MEVAMLAHIRDWITGAGLGPAGVTVEDVIGTEVLMVSLSQDDRRCRTLRRWTTGPLEIADMILGRRNNNDPLRRLCVRGRITTPDGSTVPGIVSVPFAVAHDRAALRLIQHRLDQQNPRLIDELARRELATAQTRR